MQTHRMRFSWSSIQRKKKWGEIMDKATIASLTQEEWESLDLWKWLIAHYKPYTGPIAQTMKRRFGCYEPNEVENLIYDAVYPALVSIHRSNLNAKGEARNQVLFRTLLITAKKRIPWLIGKIYPLTELRANDLIDQYKDPASRNGESNTDEPIPEWIALDTIMYAAATSDVLTDNIGSMDPDLFSDDDDIRKSIYVERLRPFMPKRWHQVFRMSVCDRLEPREISLKLGVSQDHVYTMRSRIKRLLSDILHRNKLTPSCN